MAYENRESIPTQYTWDLSSMYQDDTAFLQALEATRACPGQFLAFRGTIAQDPAQLLAFLQLDDAVGIELGKLVNYANRKSDEDTRDSTYQDYSAQVITLYTQIAGSQSWFSSELLTLEDEQMEAFYAQEPQLEGYRRALDRVFARREHTLSPAEERLTWQASPKTSSACSTTPTSHSRTPPMRKERCTR